MESGPNFPPENFSVETSSCLYCRVYPIDEDCNSELCTHCFNKREVITLLSCGQRFYEMFPSASDAYSIAENYIMNKTKALTVGETKKPHILHASFNQNASSLAVGHENGYTTYSIRNPKDIKQECELNVQHNISLIERFYNTSLALFISQQNYKKLYAYNISTKEEIFNRADYSKEILSIKTNRRLIVVCTEESLYLYDSLKLKEKLLDKIITSNPLGLLDLATKHNADYEDELSYLAFPDYPIGQIRVFDADCSILKDVCIISAYNEPLAALKFNTGGTKLATASEKGIVIKVFEVPSGNLLHQFTRGVFRSVTIHSLAFSVDSKFLCSSSDTNTVHVFNLTDKENSQPSSNPSINNEEEMQKAVQTWSEYIAQTGSSLLEMSQQTASAYLDSLYEKACSILPSQLNELMFLERSFAFAKLPVDGTKTVVAMHRINNKDFIMVASYTGYLFIYAMNPNGGECSLESQHIIGPLSEEQDYQESRLNERREHLTEVNQTPTAPRLYPSLHVDEEEK